MIKKRHRAGAWAFTLVELLVVISIIALLIAILIPSLSKARKQAKKLVCQTNMRSLSMAAFTYVSEYGVYPPSVSNFADSNVSAMSARRWEGGVDWLGIGDQGGEFVEGTPNDPQSGNPKGFASAPRFGALWNYVGQDEAYLCPEDLPGPVEPGTILGGGGNGKFSYTIFSNLGLRAPDNIPTRLTDAVGGSRGGGGSQRRLPKLALSSVPLFVEEHPEGINDRGVSGHMEGNFNFNTDKVVSRHVPFSKRPGVKPGQGLSSFSQGTTDIGFADGHVDDLAVNFGFTASHVRPTGAGGQGLGGIPYTASGLLYHFGIEYVVIDAATGKDVE